MGKHNGKKWALGAVIAAAAGYVAGLLTAPKSGKETQREIREVSTKLLNESENHLTELYNQISSTLENVKKGTEKLSNEAGASVDVVVGEAKKAKQKAQEVLEAFKKGDSSDEDLDKAVKDTETAIKNLKRFLRKD